MKIACSILGNKQARLPYGMLITISKSHQPLLEGPRKITRLLLPSFPLIVLAKGTSAQSFNLLVLQKGNRTEAIFTKQLVIACSVIAASSATGRGE